MSDFHVIAAEVESLCGELFEEIIDEPKLRRLEKLVREDPEAKRVYVEYINLHAALGHYMVSKLSPGNVVSKKNLPGVEGVSVSNTTNKHPQADAPLPIVPLDTMSSGWDFLKSSIHNTTIQSWWLLIGALSFLTLAGVWLFGYGFSSNSSYSNNDQRVQVAKIQGEAVNFVSAEERSDSAKGYIARLTWFKTPDGSMPTGGKPNCNASVLSKGEVLRIQSGDVHIRFACGAEVSLHGPAVFHIVSEKLARLEYGTLEAKVPPQAVGFLIDTPASRVIDLGTEFSVTVADNGNTNINVINGEVEAEPWRPNLIGDQLRRKLFEGDSLKLSPPVTESFRVDFDTPDSLDVFDIVRHDPTTCLLDPVAGLLTLKSQKGSICRETNDNSNIFVVPIPNCDFNVILTVKRFEPHSKNNHISLAAFNDQDNIYRISYWHNSYDELNPDGKRSFVCTAEENAFHRFVKDTNGIYNHLIDMGDRPFRMRIVRKENTISTKWSEESGPWFSIGEIPCHSELRFVGFFVAEGKGQKKSECTDCVIDSFELNLPPSEPQNK